MKDQYVGDIGDYGKYALLQAFSKAGVRVGVNWYLTDNDGSNDGKFVNYLKEDRMRWYDSEVFDALKKIANKEKKSVKDILKSGIITDAIFYDKKIDASGSPKERDDFRKEWLKESESALADADLIFMDPDNGLLENGNASKLGAEKYILPEEVEKYFRAGHDVVYYCHKGRRSYAAWHAYISLMFDRIPEAKPAVLTYHKGSQRSYVFLIYEDNFKKYRKIIDIFTSRWNRIFTEEFTNRGNVSGKVEEAFTIEKSNGTRVTISKRADGQIAVESSSNNCTMIIPPDLFCRETGNDMLKVNDLSVYYGEKQPLILQNLSFDLQRGSILNILGQNAVRKTTLIRCLIRELTNYNGKIMIDDQDVRSFSIKEYAKKVGVVSASFQAYQNLLVADYLLTGFANQLSNFSRPTRTMVDKAYSTLDGFNKPELFNKQIDQLSSGEMQLVMIARVIIQDPQIIIVDEPTANLDVKNQIFVLEQILRLSNQGYTVIITTHNPGHAVKLGGKTLLMGRRKYLFGDTSEVINGDRLTEYYDLNVMIQKESNYQVTVFTDGESNAIKLVL